MSDRIVVRVAPEPPREEKPRPFSSYSKTPNVVLLGEPGGGKTHLFRHAANAEGGAYMTARQFLVSDLSVLAGAKLLFIDALDEKRAARGDETAVDAIILRLALVKPTQVRIACRAADWLGETDLAIFNTYFSRHGGCAVVSLQPLGDAERQRILAGTGVADSAGFVRDAQSRGLNDLLSNPQNLLMLAEAVVGGGWPKSRTELYEKSTQLLLQEHNRSQERRETGQFSAAEISEAAGALCAARLIGDIDGFSLSKSDSNPDFPSYKSIASIANTEKALAALCRRIFAGDRLSETVDYAHRTLAEFLGASWLAERIRHGLPLGRVVALIGVGGRPASELRGLHAWLAVLLPEQAETLVDADPYGILSYGDPAGMSFAHRKRLVGALAKLAEDDPGFRSDRSSTLNLGALANPDMALDFHDILATRSTGDSLRSIVLDALVLGTPIPKLLPDLVAILPVIPKQRVMASTAFSGSAPENGRRSRSHPKTGGGQKRRPKWSTCSIP